MSIWRSLTADEKVAAVKRGLLDGLSIGLIAARAGAPDGSVATLIRRHHLRSWLRDEQAMLDRVARATGTPWRDLDRDGRIAAIRTGIADGLTTSEIARRHGTTRSAICGAANRAGIRFSAAPVIELAERREGLGSPAAAPAAKAGAARKPPAGSDPPAAAGRVPARPAPSSPAAPFPPAAGDPEPGAPGETSPEGGADPAPEPLLSRAPRGRAPEEGKRLVDLLFGDCRFPLWGRERPEFGEERFCGAAAVPGKSWCPEHRAVCVTGRAEVPKAMLAAATGGRRAGR